MVLANEVEEEVGKVDKVVKVVARVERVVARVEEEVAVVEDRKTSHLYKAVVKDEVKEVEEATVVKVEVKAVGGGWRFGRHNTFATWWRWWSRR